MTHINLVSGIRNSSRPHIPTSSSRDARTPVRFTFNGRQMVGRQGDTLAAALIANGEVVIGRSFKFHRPRGIIGSWIEDPNALVQVDEGSKTEPNVRATCLEIYDGLIARSQNVWPNAEHDVLGIFDRFRAFLPASFYYKTMMWPSWSFYERFVRPVTGLGKAPTTPDPDRYVKLTLHCDVLICGGGPAGLSAAVAAAKSGSRVIILDDRPRLGGSLHFEKYSIDGVDSLKWVQTTVAELESRPNVQILTYTSAFGYYENNVIGAIEDSAARQRGAGSPTSVRAKIYRVHAGRVVLATGAIERPLVFPKNDLPGIMLASALRCYADQYGILPGRKIIVLTNNDDAYKTALRLSEMGVRGISIVDVRTHVPTRLAQTVVARGIRLYDSYVPVGTLGAKRVRSLLVVPRNSQGAKPVRLPCDVIAMSGGWTPTIHLYSQAGGKLNYDEQLACLRPDSFPIPDCTVIGAANGDFHLTDILKAGTAAGHGDEFNISESAAVRVEVPSFGSEDYQGIEPYWYTPHGHSDKQWLDFQYDVRVRDLELAAQENFVSIEHVKRYTTGGMSVDQGKLGNINMIGVMSELSGISIDRVGTTRYRPPFQPVTIGAIGGSALGEAYVPRRQLPAHDWHVARNAVFGDYRWQRPDYYPQGNETLQEAAKREVLAIRNGVGVFDGSPLGKIEVFGPDAGKFLDRVLVNRISTMKTGMARYAIMTNDNGVILDDGVVVKMADDHFLVHATSGSVSQTTLVFERLLQVEWPDLTVGVSDVTTAWANMTLSGPKSRSVLADLGTDIDLNPTAFPHMRFRSGYVAGIRARVLRASFTGEVTFEISVPTQYATVLAEAIAHVGSTYGLVPYGIEALEIMRLEKGYLHVGADTDGQTTPLDIGFETVVSRKTDDFIGRRSLMRPAERSSGRLQLVGIRNISDTILLPHGGHIVARHATSGRQPSQGYVTSSCLSPTLSSSIGLALVKNGFNRIGERVGVFHQGMILQAELVPATHFDPEGVRLNG